MADQQLITYIETQLRKGYSVDGLRSFLVNYGYDVQTVDEAMNIVLNHHAPHGRFIIFVCVMFLIIGLGIYFYVNLTSESDEEIFDYKLTINNPKITSKETLSFKNDFNFGDKQRYDIKLTYTVTDKKTNKEIDSWSEVIEKGEQLTNEKTYGTQKLGISDYKLTVDITYGDTRKQYFKSFKVVDEKKQTDTKGPPPTVPPSVKQSTNESCSDKIKNQGETDVDCGGPCSACETCFDNLKNQDESGIDCGGICVILCKASEEPQIHGTKDQDNYEVYDNAKALASNNPQESYTLCNTLVDASLRNDCFDQIAKIANSSVFCNGIVNSLNKDSCLMYFVTNFHEFSVCQGFHDDQFKAMCKGLEDLDKIKKVQQQENKTDEQKGEELLKALNVTIVEQPTPPSETSPEITAIGFNHPEERTANITWATNMLGDSTVYYGIDETKLIPVFDGSLTTDHVVLLQNLDQNTQYIFKVRSVMDNKVKESDYYSFICCSMK